MWKCFRNKNINWLIIRQSKNLPFSLCLSRASRCPQPAFPASTLPQKQTSRPNWPPPRRADRRAKNRPWILEHEHWQWHDIDNLLSSFSSADWNQAGHTPAAPRAQGRKTGGGARTEDYQSPTTSNANFGLSSAKMTKRRSASRRRIWSTS